MSEKQVVAFLDRHRNKSRYGEKTLMILLETICVESNAFAESMWTTWHRLNRRHIKWSQEALVPTRIGIHTYSATA